MSIDFNPFKQQKPDIDEVRLLLSLLLDLRVRLESTAFQV